jgi:hypothetical protein
MANFNRKAIDRVLRIHGESLGVPVTKKNRDRAASLSHLHPANRALALVCGEELSAEDLVGMSIPVTRENRDRVAALTDIHAVNRCPMGDSNGNFFDELDAVNRSLERHDEFLSADDLRGMSRNSGRQVRIRPNRSAINRVLERLFESV